MDKLLTMLSGRKILIAGGTGFIGQQLVKRWRDNKISIVGRHKAKITKCLPHVTPLDWHDLKKDGKALFSEQDLVINLTGANIGDGRWSKQKKEAIIESRVTSSNLFASICEELGPNSPIYFNASAIGVYDLHEADHDAYTENTPIDFSAKPNFLAKVARAWENATHISNPQVRKVNMRFAVVFSQEGGALPKMAMPFKFGIGGKVGSGEQIMSWIHIEDLIRAIAFIYTHESLSGPINFSAPESINQMQFAKTLGKVLKRPILFPTPAIALKLAFGNMAEELLLKGQRVYPKKLLDAGFEFKYGTLKKALENIYLV